MAESWREALAHNIALRNPGLTSRELNFAVQVTIDRIIFLRICEDRGIETYGELLAQTNGSDVYQRLLALFQKADDRYNSGLFHFHPEKDRSEPPDELTPGLTIDDKPLREIIRSLYYPDCPYEFSVLPAEILGHVYEQFLGKVITLTAGHHARVEDKPEVKARHDRMVALVEQMLDLHRQLAKAKTPHEKTALERQIDTAAAQIDRLVYDLYGLTDEEIRIVEQSA
jgi:hypothetical protein